MPYEEVTRTAEEEVCMDKSTEEEAVIVHRATIADVEKMHELINVFAQKGLMLPRSRNQFYQDIRDFFVAEKGGEFAGCGALHVTWSDLCEVRSLAVVEKFQGNGVGHHIVKRLLEDAHALKLPRVFALTYQRAFFESMGFTEIDKDELPHKVWGECINCPKFPNCDETAVVLDL